jgi:hypothetical protein
MVLRYIHALYMLVRPEVNGIMEDFLKERLS